MTLKTKYLALITIGVSAIALNACGHPGSMPSGYTYHHDTYKSSDFGGSPHVTDTQRQYMDALQAEQFRDAVYDVLSRLTMRAGMPPKPVYVIAASPMTNFYANIDNDLRESMRHIGYAISDTPHGAYVFSYSADLIKLPRDQMDKGHANVDLTLNVYNGLSADSSLLSTERGSYYIKGAEHLNIRPTSNKGLPKIDMPAKDVSAQYQPSSSASSSSSSFRSQPAPAVVRTQAMPQISTQTNSMTGRVSKDMDVDLELSQPTYRREAPADIQLNQYSNRAASPAGSTPSYATSIQSDSSVEVSRDFNSGAESTDSMTSTSRARVSPRVEY